MVPTESSQKMNHFWCNLVGQWQKYVDFTYMRVGELGKLPAIRARFHARVYVWRRPRWRDQRGGARRQLHGVVLRTDELLICCDVLVYGNRIAW